MLTFFIFLGIRAVTGSLNTSFTQPPPTRAFAVPTFARNETPQPSLNSTPSTTSQSSTLGYGVSTGSLMLEARPEPTSSGPEFNRLRVIEPATAHNFRAGFIIGKEMRVVWNYTKPTPPKLLRIYAQRPSSDGMIVYPISNAWPGDQLELKWNTAEYQLHPAVPQLVAAYDYMLVFEDASDQKTIPTQTMPFFLYFNSILHGNL
ncbi:hypothetical protein DSO57_1016130 [Entomophthora muscae]|uniref:Uncharacterized protein n=1 Tax=Entomophthora muscae TaxID=34485 RepID=A0ACC2SHN2_9FUNG|nr:hypothetical protein DSO57_1016130 [Entomophthora muscae]